MDPATSYFLKKYYPHVIKWWLVIYNPEFIRIWPSKEEEDEAMRIEAEEKAALELELQDDDAYNATTGSYSGLYGQKPVDDSTQAALDAIMSASSNQNSVDSLLSNNISISEEQQSVIDDANAIYERLLREAAEDEAKKQAQIEEARKAAEIQFQNEQE
jgi:hypothetical protein